ncbi:MAG: diguanylate cyclase [Chloroflexi bacterium]|nr:diguanylate cyclase [Chloroflexota bacterium]
MKPKRYTGYRSYSYLEAGVDYRPFDLVPELGRVPSHTVELGPADEARAGRLLAENIVVSLHDHTAIAVRDIARDSRAYRREGRDWTGYEALSTSGLDAVFDCMMNGANAITSQSGWKWTDTIHDLGQRLADIAHQDMVIVGRAVSDIRRAHRDGQIAFIPALEAVTCIENEIDRLDVLYGLGIRCAGVSYAMANALGGGGREASDGGLTDFGRRAVRRMNRLGMAVDVSHCGVRTALDVVAASERPIVISHVGARALWNIPRLLPDEVFTACAAKGGVIGIEAAALTTATRARPRQTIDSVMEHFEHVAHLVGIDHVAFGPDTNFGDHVAQLRLTRPHLFAPPAPGAPAFEPIDYVEGLENPGECFPNIVRWLVKHGYSDGDVAKVLGGNILRVLGEVWV